MTESNPTTFESAIAAGLAAANEFAEPTEPGWYWVEIHIAEADARYRKVIEVTASSSGELEYRSGKEGVFATDWTPVKRNRIVAWGPRVPEWTGCEPDTFENASRLGVVSTTEEYAKLAEGRAALARAEELRDGARKLCESRTRDLETARSILARTAVEREVGATLLDLLDQLRRLRSIDCPTRRFDWTSTGMIREVQSELDELDAEVVGSTAAKGEAMDVVSTALQLALTHDVEIHAGLLAASSKIRTRVDHVLEGGTWTSAKGLGGIDMAYGRARRQRDELAETLAMTGVSWNGLLTEVAHLRTGVERAERALADERSSHLTTMRDHRDYLAKLLARHAPVDAPPVPAANGCPTPERYPLWCVDNGLLGQARGFTVYETGEAIRAADPQHGRIRRCRRVTVSEWGDIGAAVVLPEADGSHAEYVCEGDEP